MEETKLTLDDIKDYVDSVYGEFTGEDKADVIQCDYEEGKKDKLIFYMFDCEIDNMIKIGFIDGNLNLHTYNNNALNIIDVMDDDTDNIKEIVNLIFYLLIDMYTAEALYCQCISKEIERITKPKVEEWVDVNG